MALLDPGDRILGMKLDHGGHLSHGMKINFSGLYFDIVAYGVREEDSRLDMDELAQIAEDSKPKLIIAGWSAYPRQLDFQRFREIADSVGALLMADMAHFAGLVAAEGAPEPRAVLRRRHHHHPQDARRRARRDDPVPRGVREEDRLARLPGPPGRPADAQRSPARRSRSRSPSRTSSASASGAPARARRSWPEEMVAAGVNVLTGGTDVHLVLADLRESELDGKQAEDRLHEVGITVNRNAVPFDPRPPAVSSGLRIGTPGARHARLPGRRLPRGRPGHRRGAHRRVRATLSAASSPSAPARWPTSTRSTRSSRSPRSPSPSSSSRASGWRATAGRCCAT